jgi:hypothetical protein
VTPIDRLYSLPLGEFTAARNALAKESGKDAAQIRTLPKPGVPAWAVNQLYWHHRQVYNTLIAAAEKMRTANKQAVAGKKADVAATEKAHQFAIKAAMNTVRGILAASGEDGASPSSATLNAVSDTLNALPSKEPPGRLTKPLKLIGFEAFAGFGGLPAARPTLVEPAARARAANEKLGHAKTAKHDAKAEAARKKAEEREAKAREGRLSREKKRLEQELAAARKKERAAHAAREQSRRALERAEQETERLRFAVSAATKEVDRLREELVGAERTASNAEGERAAIENDLKNY